jgi:hypothetical protein
MNKPDPSDACRAVEAKIAWMVRVLTIRFAAIWGVAGFIIWRFGLCV